MRRRGEGDGENTRVQHCDAELKLLIGSAESPRRRVVAHRVLGVDVSAEGDEDVDAVCVAAWVVDKGLWRLSAAESATPAGPLLSKTSASHWESGRPCSLGLGHTAASHWN